MPLIAVQTHIVQSFLGEVEPNLFSDADFIIHYFESKPVFRMSNHFGATGE